MGFVVNLSKIKQLSVACGFELFDYSIKSAYDDKFVEIREALAYVCLYRRISCLVSN